MNLAYTPDTGDAAFYLGPKVTVQAGDHRSLFAFVQLPLYQRVNGFQLEPRWLISAGLRWSR